MITEKRQIIDKPEEMEEESKTNPKLTDNEQIWHPDLEIIDLKALLE